MYAIISFRSLSLITIIADIIFDFLLNITFIVANCVVNYVNSHRFPFSKAYIETTSNITFCFIMSTVSAVIIILSVCDLASSS
jgi:hypothetical protein